MDNNFKLAMNYGKKIALFRPSSRSIESESVISFDELEDDEKDNVKRKTRNLSEKKRRDQFNVLINELCSMVAANTKKMDKSSVLKSAIQFLRNHQEFSVQSAANEIKEDWKPTFLCNEEFAQLMLEAVDSFLVVFTQQGKILFTSDSVTSLLGHLSADLINHSLYDLMHEDDRVKFFNLLSKHSSQDASDEKTMSFTCHLRRGSIDPSEPITYEYVRVFGTSQMIGEPEDDAMVNDNSDFIGIDLPEQSLCFCCTVRLQTSHIIREMSTVDETTNEFTSRHSLEWKFLFLDHRAPPIIGYLPFEVLGTSGYDYYHPDDLEMVSKCHEQLMAMGKGTSSFYRFLTKGQQWIWLQTRYFITYHQWNSKPEFITCTNTVVSYQDVRKQLRQDMGYVDGDSPISTNNSSTAANSSDNGSFPSGTVREGRSSQEGHVTSFSQPTKSTSALNRRMVQSPDVASSQHAESDRPQRPHSTKQESTNIRKHVSSQLQSLLQLHLQRSLGSSTSTAATAAAATTTHSTHATSITTTAAPAKSSSTTHSSSIAQTMVTSSSQSNLVSQSDPSTVTSQRHSVPSLVPVMAAMPGGLVTMASSHRLMSTVQSTVPTSIPVESADAVTSHSALASTAGQRSSFQNNLVLTPAQQLLHEQLVHKSEQLQNAIQRQQEELRLIKEQLAFAQGTGHMLQQQQQQQQLSQQEQLQQQQTQSQQQQQHQYILQQRLGMGTPSMLLAPTNTSPQLAMMSSSPNQIFLSPITGVNMDLPGQQQQAQVQLQQQQQQQYQQQQIVLQHDSGMGTQQMLLAPTSPSPQLAMMGAGSSQIFLSPISMDLLPQQQQQQQLQQCQQQQQQSLHYAGPSPCSGGGNTSDPGSTKVDLSDSC